MFNDGQEYQHKQDADTKRHMVKCIEADIRIKQVGNPTEIAYWTHITN